MAALRVLIIAEGPSEIGELDQLAGYHLGKRAREGYVPTMLRKLLGVPLHIQAQRITKIGSFGKKPRLPGDGDRAAQAAVLAELAECELLVFVKDVDRQHGTKKTPIERRRKLKEMHRQIDDGFAAANAAGVVCVKATPCRMIEAWALGDRDAVARVGGRHACVTEVPRAPEELWGDERDPSSQHPKCVIRRALGRDLDAGVFEDLATESRPDMLAKTCSESFAPFVGEVARASGKLGSPRPDAGEKKSRRSRGR